MLLPLDILQGVLEGSWREQGGGGDTAKVPVVVSVLAWGGGLAVIRLIVFVLLSIDVTKGALDSLPQSRVRNVIPVCDLLDGDGGGTRSSAVAVAVEVFENGRVVGPLLVEFGGTSLKSFLGRGTCNKTGSGKFGVLLREAAFESVDYRSPFCSVLSSQVCDLLPHDGSVQYLPQLL